MSFKCPTLLSFVIFFSCQPSCPDKINFLSNFESFTAEVAQGYESYSSDDWMKQEKKFRYYLTTCYSLHKTQLDNSERIAFWKGALDYGLRRSSEDESYEFDLNNYGISLEEEIKEISEAGQEEIERFLKEEFGPELEHIFDSLIRELEGIGDDLKTWIENL